MTRAIAFLSEMWIAIVAFSRQTLLPWAGAAREAVARFAARHKASVSAKAASSPEFSLRALCELACMFAALLLVEYVILGPGSLASFSPHPFWFPVLLLSAQYGTASGLTAAVAAIALGWAVGWPPQKFGEEFYVYSIRLWHQPMLWLCTAILLGELRNRHIHERIAQSERLTEADAQRQSIAQLCVQLQAHNQELNRRIACAQDQSISTALAALTALRNATPDTASHALATAVKVLIGPAKYAVLVPRDGGLAIVPQFADTPSQRSPETGSIRPALRDAVLRDRRFLSVLRTGDAGILDGAGVLAGPILATTNGVALGVLLLEEVDADRLCEETEAALRALCAELSQSLVTSEVVVLHHEKAAADNVQAAAEHKGTDEKAVALRLAHPAGRRAGAHGH
jgi:hypothetical protein